MHIFKSAIYKKRSRGKSTKYISYVFIFLIFIILVSKYFDLERAFAFISAVETDRSLSVKLELAKYAIGIVSNSNPFCLIFGMSPGARYIQTDFEYGYLIYWYGLTGILFYGLLVYFQLRIFSKRLGTQNGLTGMSIILAFLFYGIGGTAFINNRVYPITLALFAMMINNLSNNLKNKNINKKLFKSNTII